MNNKSKRVETRLSGELYKRLEAKAKHQKGENKSVSNLIRSYIVRGINRK